MRVERNLDVHAKERFNRRKNAINNEIRRDIMIFKVFYQDSIDLAPTRERTKTIYVEAESEREVRHKLKDREINIEYIQALDEVHLDYEKKSEDFKIESV